MKGGGRGGVVTGSTPGGGAAGRRRTGGRPTDAERLKAAAFDAAPDALVIAGRDDRVLLLNPAAEHLLGWSSAAARGLAVEVLVGVAIAELDREGASDAGRTITVRDRAGRTFPAALAIGIAPAGSGAPMVLRVRDLSAEQAASSALQAEREQRGDAERSAAATALLGGIAHELNNPLAVLLAQATLLRDKAPDPDVERRAAKIEDAARRAGRIVRDFLALAQHRAPVLAPLDLDRAIDDALDRAAFGLREAGIALQRSRGPGSRTASGDPDLLGQVFDHLVADLQAALQGRPGVRRLTVATAREGSRAVVSIGCAGPGAGPARTGTGVGLSLCRSIVAAHGGDLTLEMPPDSGQRFVVGLPALDAEVDSGRVASRPLAILVVDDEIEVGQSLAELIEMLGHAVAVETSSDLALARIRQQRFDGVFTDLRMPGLDGLALRQAIAAESPELAARTAIVTGDRVSMAPDPHRPSVAPDILTLEKPFTAAAVKATLARMAAP